MMLLAACSKESDSGGGDPEPTPQKLPDPPARGSTAERTVLIYMGGDSNLGRDGFASSDLQEMAEAVKKMDANVYSHNNLLIFYDQYSDTQLPKLYRLVKKGEMKASETDPSVQEMEISVVEELIKEYPKEITFTQPSILKEVIDEAFGIFPAKSYGLVYWSHGDGWMPGKYEALALRSIDPLRWIGVDWNNSAANQSSSFKMGIPELAEVLKNSSKKLDFLMFDACFMMTVEVAYELRGCADYIVASPTETPGPGGPYTEIVPMMFVPTQAAVRIAEAYYKYYDNKYNPNVTNTNANWTGGVSITVLDCAKLSNLAFKTKDSLPSTTVDTDELCDNVFDYDKRSSTGHVGYYDMVGLMESIMEPATFEEWQQAYLATVAYWKTTPKNYSMSAKLFSMEGANGVSHYIPSSVDYGPASLSDYRDTAWYSDAGLSQLGW